MFTGLIETKGRIISIKKYREIVRFQVMSPVIASEVRPGDSVSVSGVCLTVCDRSSETFTVEMMSETSVKTTLGWKETGNEVNLERALSASGRLDGHFVTGHVDGLAFLEGIKDMGGSYIYTFTAQRDLLDLIVRKGSVAIDGVSLTVIDSDRERFSTGLIPTTLKETTLGNIKNGEKVNVETDILAKYIFRAISVFGERNEDGAASEESLTWKKLAEYGWSF
jgi:riboflavin synthase